MGKTLNSPTLSFLCGWSFVFGTFKFSTYVSSHVAWLALISAALSHLVFVPPREVRGSGVGSFPEHRLEIKPSRLAGL